MNNIPLSKLGYGCYALGGAYGNKVDVSRAIELIHLAYDLGIRFFDTADQYGTEAILGKAVRPFRSQVALATKVGAGSGLDRKNILASCDASLKRLQTDYIDLYQIHYDDPSVSVAAVVETLELLKSQGKIRSYGVGHLPLDKTLQYLELGRPQTVLAEMNAASLERYRELRPLQQDHDFGIIAFSVTGRGLLTGKIPSVPHFPGSDIRRLDPFFKRGKLASGLRIKDKLAEIGRRLNATPAQTAIAWVLGNPGVAAALTGPTDPQHLRENCAALDLNLDSSWQQEISEFIRQEGELLQTQITQEIQSIIQAPLADGKQAREDLIYVLEHGIENGLIPYETGVDLFTELLQLRDSPADMESLQVLMAKVREYTRLNA
ncbi:MAG: aldo/keto reductase [Eubacteriales bacterium]|nr:aldo/keto reductase [Eubacteriales bacterium]